MEAESITLSVLKSRYDVPVISGQCVSGVRPGKFMLNFSHVKKITNKKKSVAYEMDNVPFKVKKTNKQK